MLTIRRLIQSVCLFVVFVAACGGSHATAQTTEHYLCCPQGSNTSALYTCSWDTCNYPSDGSELLAWVTIYSDQAVGQGKIGLVSEGPGVCFGGGLFVSDLCLSIETSPDFVPSSTTLSAIYLQNPIGSPLSAGNEVASCFSATPASCAGRTATGTVPNLCCDTPQLIPPPFTPNGLSTILFNSSLETVPKPKSFFAVPVPTMPVGMAIGLGAALLGIAVTRRH